MGIFQDKKGYWRWQKIHITSMTAFRPPHKCPICGDGLTVEDIVGYARDESNGLWMADSIVLECITQPSFSDDAFRDFMDDHYQMPYVDWLPIEMAVIDWLNRYYRWESAH